VATDADKVQVVGQTTRKVVPEWSGEHLDEGHLGLDQQTTKGSDVELQRRDLRVGRWLAFSEKLSRFFEEVVSDSPGGAVVARIPVDKTSVRRPQKPPLVTAFEEPCAFVEGESISVESDVGGARRSKSSDAGLNVD
jgi:hypothetical protein